MKAEGDKGKRIHFEWCRSWEAGSWMAHFKRIRNRHAARNLTKYTVIYCSKRIYDNTLLWNQLEIEWNDYAVDISESYLFTSETIYLSSFRGEGNVAKYITENDEGCEIHRLRETSFLLLFGKCM